MKAFVFLFSFLLFSCQTSEKTRRANDHHTIGVSLLKKCNNKAALGQLKKAVSYQPNNAFIRYTLGSAYFLLKEYDLAKKEFRRALELEPKLTEARVSLALSQIELNQNNKALRGLKKAEEDLTYVKNANIISYKAYAYFKQKKFLLARENFRKVYQASKEDFCFNYTHLGKSEFFLKNDEEAKKILKKSIFYCQEQIQKKRVCKAKPHSFEEHYFLAEIYKKEKDMKRAKYHFKIFVKRANPSNSYVLKAKKEIE